MVKGTERRKRVTIEDFGHVNGLTNIFSKKCSFIFRGVDVPFARWDGEKIASWLHDMGLTAYIGDCKRWVKNGDQLLQASPHNLEKVRATKYNLV